MNFSFFSQKLDQWQKNGFLAITANLLFDTLIVGWIAFFGFYSLETLLPTFVTVRLSLAKFFIVLGIGTAFLFAIGKKLSVHFSSFLAPRFLLAISLVWAFFIITLSLYRFPWWSIPILLFGYATAVFLLFRSLTKTTDSSY